MITSCVFITSYYVITFWYSHPHALISELIQSKSALFEREEPNISALIQNWFSAKQRCLALYSSVLNSPDSVKIRAGQLWNYNDQHWCLSCSLNQRWKTSNLWNCDDQRWCLSCSWFSDEKLQISETAMISADVFHVLDSALKNFKSLKICCCKAEDFDILDVYVF